MSESTRAYIYRVWLALAPILTLHGTINDQDIALYTTLIGTVLVSGLATVNTSTSAEDDE